MSRTDRRVKVATAQLAVYFIWGSTYLALVYGLDGFPPFILNGIRFTVAGGLLYLALRIRGETPPTRTQWWNLTKVGTLMLLGGVGLVTVAEDFGIGSGIAATAAASIPLWTALFSGLSGHWPCRTEWAGIAVGFGGVAVLSLESDLQTTAAGAVLVLVAPVLWSLGSILSKRVDLPGTWMATSGQLLAGGAVLLVVGPVLGERIAAVPSFSSVLALGYLTAIGSIVAYTAYMYLLRELSPTAATSYAYVNPIVAVVLGVTIGGEVIAGPAFVALPLILAGVGLIGVAQRGGIRLRRRSAAAREAA